MQRNKRFFTKNDEKTASCPNTSLHSLHVVGSTGIAGPYLIVYKRANPPDEQTSRKTFVRSIREFAAKFTNWEAPTQG